jgi:hypothetical protein
MWSSQRAEADTQRPLVKTMDQFQTRSFAAHCSLRKQNVLFASTACGCQKTDPEDRKMTPGRAELVPSKVANYDYFTKVPRLRPRLLLPPLEKVGNKILGWRIIKIFKKIDI